MLLVTFLLKGRSVFRTLVGYAVFAVIGVVALKLIMGLLGFAFSLLMTLLWFAVIGFVFYLILKLISPRTAERVKETIRGESQSG